MTASLARFEDLGPARFPPRRRATIDAIFEAVTRLAATTKLEDVKGADICRVAGVSPGTLYQYFPTLDDLFTAWEARNQEVFVNRLTSRLREMYSEWSEAVAAGKSPPLEPYVTEIVHMGLAGARDALAHYRDTDAVQLLRRVRSQSSALESLAHIVALSLTSTAAPGRLPADPLLAARIIVNTVACTGMLTAKTVQDHAAYDREIGTMIARYLLVPEKARPIKATPTRTTTSRSNVKPPSKGPSRSSGKSK
jgi:AcrR family transcriptional regulator